MFEKASELIKVTELEFESLAEKLEVFKQARDKLSRSLIPHAREALKEKESPEYATKLAKLLIDEIKKGSPEVLMKEIDDAVVRSSKEFEENSTLYKFYLYSVAKDLDIYKLIPSGEGWTITISPQIVFEGPAGTLADYARGISAYRASLKVKEGGEGSGRGAKATSWWRRHVYGTELYDKTIEGRIGITGKTAPFWQLINNGSTSMPSDRTDGSYNPYPSKPIDFIGNAEEKIKKTFKTRFKESETLWKEEILLAKNEIDKAIKIRDGFSSDVKQLRTEMKQNQRVLESLGDRKEYVDQNLLEKAMEQYRVGKKFNTPSGQRINIGTSRRVYLTTRLVEGFE
jgi:hypothetical protein